MYRSKLLALPRNVLASSFSLNYLDLRLQHTQGLSRLLLCTTRAIDKFNGVRMCFWISVDT